MYMPYKLCTSLLMILKMKSPFNDSIDNRNGNKKVGLIRAYFVFSFYNVENNENIHLNNGETLEVKWGCYTVKDMEIASSGKVKQDSLKENSELSTSWTQMKEHEMSKRTSHH